MRKIVVLAGVALFAVMAAASSLPGDAVADEPWELPSQRQKLEQLRRDLRRIERRARESQDLLMERTGDAVVFGTTPGISAKLFHFDKTDVGKLPAGWTAAHTGKGEGSVWKVVADPSTPSKSGYALAQAAESPAKYFNLCVSDKPELKNVALRVAFKAVEGKEDQGGGLVWRYQDANNYYIARMNPLEDNLRVYKVINGTRIQLDTKEGLKVPAGEWHTLAVRHEGDKIECSLDDRKYLTVTDTAIPGAGKVGLWTKADARSYFDGLEAADLGQ